MAPGTATLDRRALYAGLMRRNRRVGVLRLAVPVAGLAAFALLVGQIYLIGLARDYGVSGIRVDRGNLVVETPQYSGTGAGGARYLVTARTARTPLANPAEIDMTDATLDYTRPGRPTYFVTAAAAAADTAAEIVTIPGLARVVGDDGLIADLFDVRADMARQTITSGNPVHVEMPDGTLIDAAAMHHDGVAQTWTFTRATVVVPGLPRAEGEPLPDAAEAAP